MVPSRKTIPRMMRTIGPAKERCLGGIGGTGTCEYCGVVTGLDIFHLARRGGICTWRRWRCCARTGESPRHSRWWRSTRWIARSTGRQRADVTTVRSIALDEFHDSDDQQDRGPSLAEIHVRDIVEQEQYAQRDQHCRAHQPASSATLADTRWPISAHQSPMFGEEIYAQHD